MWIMCYYQINVTILAWTEEHRSIVVRALAFGAGGPRFKSRRGEKFFLLKPEFSYFQIRRECARQLTRKTRALRKMMPGTDEQSCSIVEPFRSRGTRNTKKWLQEENEEIRERMVRFEFAARLNGRRQTWSNMERKIDNVYSFSSWLSIYKYD